MKKYTEKKPLKTEKLTLYPKNPYGGMKPFKCEGFGWYWLDNGELCYNDYPMTGKNDIGDVEYFDDMTIGQIKILKYHLGEFSIDNKCL